MLQFTFTFRAMKFFLHIYVSVYPFLLLEQFQDSSLYIQVISLPSSLSLLGSVSKWKVLPAYSDSPSIDTLEFAKALSSEVKNESLLNHLMSAEIIRYPIPLTTILTLICKSIHLFMLKDNQIPSLLVNVKEGEKSLTGKGKMDDLKYSICRGHLSDELFAYERKCNWYCSWLLWIKHVWFLLLWDAIKPGL